MGVAKASVDAALSQTHAIFRGIKGAMFTLLIIAALHVPFLASPTIRGLPPAGEGQQYLFNLWQVSAAVLGIVFVILIFVIEMMHRTDPGGFVWERFSRTPRLYVVTAFVLGTLAAIGFGAFALGGNLGTPPGLLNLVVLDALLFVAALLGILYLYVDVLRLLAPAAVHALAIGSLTDVVRLSVTKTLRRRITNTILYQVCQQYGLTAHAGVRDWPGMEPVRITQHGIVTDINLKSLKELASRLDSVASPKAVVTLDIGSRVTSDATVAMLIRPDNLSDEVRQQVGRCFRVAKKEPEPPVALEAAFGFLTAQALGAIETGYLEQFQRSLEGLQQPARIALRTLRDWGIVMDAASAKNIFGFEWPAFERPFREYQRIIEAAARSSDTNVILEAAAWPFEVMRLAIEEKDHYFFRQAVHHLPYLYRLGRNNDTSERARSLLGDRAWRHLKETGWRVEEYTRAATDPAVVPVFAGYAAELLDAYVTLLKMAVDAGDRFYFEVASRGFWQTFRVREEEFDLLTCSATPGVSEERSDRLLQRAKAEFARAVRDRREVVWMALGGWVCQRWADSRLSVEMARDAFNGTMKPFSNFSDLWRAFNAGLMAESADRLPLSDWQMEDQPEGEVVWVRPEAYLAMFFTLVALTNIPAKIDERFRSLAPPKEASWIKGQVESALGTFNAKKELWAQLIGGIDRSEQEERIRRLVEAAEAYERRRVEERVMEQDLSSSKLDDFKASFLASWASGGLLRRLFADAGLIDFVEGSRSDDEVLGLYTFMPKDPFVEDTGNVHWYDVGDSFGRGVSSGENAAIYNGLRQNAHIHQIGTRPLSRRLSEVIRVMRKAEMPPDTILVGRFDTPRMLQGTPGFVPFYAIEGDRPPLFEGTFEGIPIYLYGGMSASELMVASLAAAGRLRQYTTVDESVFRTFEVKGFSEMEAREIASGDRGLLPAEERDLSEDEIINYLRAHVTVKIQESLEVLVGNRAALRVLVLGSASAAEPGNDEKAH